MYVLKVKNNLGYPNTSCDVPFQVSYKKSPSLEAARLSAVGSWHQSLAKGAKLQLAVNVQTREPPLLNKAH